MTMFLFSFLLPHIPNPPLCVSLFSPFVWHQSFFKKCCLLRKVIVWEVTLGQIWRT